MATTTANMIVTPSIALNPHHLSSSTISTAASTMVTTVMLPAAGRVSSIRFCRPPLAAYVSLKASSRSFPWRTVAKSGCEIHPLSDDNPTVDDESQNDRKGSHLERSESMEKEMYQNFLTHKYENFLKSAHLWERSKTMQKIYHYYKKAVYKSGHPNKRSIVISNSAVAYALVSVLQKYPFKFSRHHKAIRAPFDYYEFGLKYFRPLIDFKNSYVGNISIFQEIEEKIQKGENVILMSNHPREVDLVFIALLLESTHPFICENMTYVMETGVLSDNPFYKIFNMGRTFIHFEDSEESVSYGSICYHDSVRDEIISTLRSGSKLVWYSPVTRYYGIDRMLNDLKSSDVPFHVYPLALLSFDHPIQVERLLSFQGVGLSIGHQMDFDDDEQRSILYDHSIAVLEFIKQQDMVLKSAIIEKHGLAASDDMVSLSQPFIS